MRVISIMCEKFLVSTLMIDDSETSVIIRKRARSKTLRLSVGADGRVVLSVPRFISLLFAKRFLATKQDWITAARERMRVLPPRLLHQGDKEEYQAVKEEARRRITERVIFFERHYGSTARSLSVRNQRSRFGSCSARGHLSFNYRLLFLPPDLFDYVIVHEVCHLKELNHSRQFWGLVAETVPDYQERKQRLQAFSRDRVA